MDGRTGVDTSERGRLAFGPRSERVVNAAAAFCSKGVSQSVASATPNGSDEHPTKLIENRGFEIK
jgi:hypothetical protein